MNTNSYESKITVNDIEIMVLKKDIKNFHLNVLPPEWKVRISVPFWTNQETVRNFAVTRLPWIKKQIADFKGQERQTKREYVSWETHYFKWKPYRLKIVEKEKWKPEISIKNKKYIVFAVKNWASLDYKEKAMNSRYRKELENEVMPLIQNWQEIIGVSVDKRWIRKVKRMWWSCNQPKKTIRLNLELIKKPTQCIEYVVVHELVHLKERTHNENFINYMDQYMPTWRSRRNELNNMVLSYSMA